ncbi:MAG: Ig-like domain-containing protein [Chloroflexi bacterium]|nr:Ig-like domain-containing protein [Chloroflexota bacterium]
MIPNSVVRRLKALIVFAGIGLIALFVLGAGPSQGGVPPQPYGANFFSGVITVQGEIPPVNTKVIGCVADCIRVFESEPVLTDADGNYVALQLNPDDEELVGRIIYFYLVNEFGRISASETRRFEGDFNIYDLDLTFIDPLPVVAPTPAPPTLSLVPETGLVTTINGGGFSSGSLVTLMSQGTVLGTVIADGNGRFRIVITAPSSVAGEYQVTSTDAEGRSGSATLTVPDLTGQDGLAGAKGSTGPGGADGNQGAPGPTGSDASLVLPVVALTLAGLAILIIIVMYLYLVSWYKDLVRRLPPPGIR